MLYHYTDTNGLEGILNPTSWPIEPGRRADFRVAAKMFATDVRFMNDTQELKFGADVLRAHLQRASGSSEIPEEMRTAFGDLVDWFDPDAVVGGEARCYAACFCAEGDVLSQWRGYAGGTGGFAIGFDWESVAGHTYAFHPHPAPGAGPWSFRAELRPVVYGIDDAAQRADTAINALVEAWTKHQVVLRDGKPYLFLLAAALFRVVATIKHAGFKEECEWRLFSPGEGRYPTKLRAGRFGEAPYVEMAINLRGDSDTCSHRTIADLVVGPGPDQAGQVMVAQELLKATGHDPDVVRPSNTPLRG